MISLLAGKPNPSTFPFSSLTVSLKPIIPGDKAEVLTIDGDHLTEALQYSATAGLPQLCKWIEELQTKVHKRAKDETWRISVGSGSQDLIAKVRTLWSRLRRAVVDSFLNCLDDGRFN